MSAPPDVARALAAVAAGMRRSGKRWYVFGAQAVVAYGEPRLTADLDITAAATPDQIPELVAALVEAGLQLRVQSTDDFVRRTGVLPFVHRETGLPVDVVLAGPGLEEEFLAAARDIDLGGVTVPVIGPEDLIVTKILAGRPKDLGDVRGVLREQLPDLDLERCRRFLGLLEEALARADLLAQLDRLLAGVREG